MKHLRFIWPLVISGIMVATVIAGDTNTPQNTINQSNDSSVSNTKIDTMKIYRIIKKQKALDKMVLEELLELARKGDQDAQFRLGTMFEEGKGVSPDLAMAAKWYIEAATQGNDEAQYKVGTFYVEGKGGVSQDDHKATEWFIKAAEQKHWMATYLVGISFENGEGVSQNYDAAAKWYLRGANMGHPGAQARLAGLYFKGQGVSKNDSEGAKWLKRAAERGYDVAQAELARIYDLGIGVQRDEVEANKWRRKAADQDHPWAQWTLGYHYETGRGIEKNIEIAASWYLKAAENGHETAQVSIGDFYRNGTGVPKDNVQAVKWYSIAAENGDTDGQVKLGEMYEKGSGVEKSLPKAMFWYQKAAEQPYGFGYEGAIKLGWLYYYGKGTNKDIPLAISWWRKAAESRYCTNSKYILDICEVLLTSESGDSKAKYTLGFDYYFGGWFLEDKQYAMQLIREAANDGVADAQLFLGDRYFHGDGVFNSTSIAVDWYYKAGISFLKSGGREEALTCVERIKKLSGAPNSFLADKLLTRIYGKGSEQTSPQPEEEQATNVVSGTGWPVAGGFVVTNHHVVADHENIILLRRDGEQIRATVAVYDAVNDLALLKPESTEFLSSTLPLADSSIQVGEQVFTVGYPHPDMMGAEAKLTQGIVNARTGLGGDPRMYQISVPMQAGNSGGPLLNMNGEVVGVVVAKMSAVKVFEWTGDLPQNVNYAVKAGYVRMLLSSVDPDINLPVLPAKADDLPALADRVVGSVLMVIAQ